MEINTCLLLLYVVMVPAVLVPTTSGVFFLLAAASWRISQEEFYHSDILTDLKLRVSYGITGNQEIGNYNSLNTLGASTNGYLVGGEKVTIVLPQQYSNPDIKWEQTAQTDIGLISDFSTEEFMVVLIITIRKPPICCFP